MDVNGRVEGFRAGGAAALATIWGFSLQDIHLLINSAAALALFWYTVFQAIVIMPKVWATLRGWFLTVASWVRPKRADVD